MPANHPAPDAGADRRRNVYDATMQAVHAGSTDARLDAIAGKIDDLSRRVDKRFEQVDKRFERVEWRLERIDERFHRMQQALIAGGFLIIAALISLNAA